MLNREDFIRIENYSADSNDEALEIHSATTNEAPLEAEVRPSAGVALGKQFQTAPSGNQKYSPGSAALTEEKPGQLKFKNIGLLDTGPLPPKKLDYKELPPRHGKSASKELAQIDEHRRSLSSKHSQNDIDYKMIAKPLAQVFQRGDFKLAEEAIYNLEAIVPQSLKRSKASAKAAATQQFVTQKQMLNSLEKVTAMSKVHMARSVEDQNHIYRLVLKVHDQLLFIEHPLTVPQQIEILVKLLSYEVSKIETKLLADQTCRRCLLQKAFLGLLDNMAERMNLKDSAMLSRGEGSLDDQNNLTFQNVDEHPSDQEALSSSQKKGSAKEFRITELKSSIKSSMKAAGSQNLSPERQRSSAARKLQRKLAKESSPVRAFLDEPREAASSEFSLQEIPQDNLGIQLSSMFDNQLSAEREGTVTKRSSKNYKRLLKCLRAWKQFTSVRKQAKNEEMLARELEAEQRLSTVESEVPGFSQSCLTEAQVHHSTALLSKGLSALIIHAVEEQKRCADLK